MDGFGFARLSTRAPAPVIRRYSIQLSKGTGERIEMLPPHPAASNFHRSFH